MGFLSIIMTKATGVDLITTRSQEGTLPYIMLATRHLVIFIMVSSSPRATGKLA